VWGVGALDRLVELSLDGAFVHPMEKYVDNSV
jgi:hypothetical protein